MLNKAICLLHCAFIICLVILFTHCDKELSTTQPDMNIYNGKILFDSNPQGAAIFLNGDNTGKFTPDSIIHLKAGTYDVTFKFEPYLDIIDSVVLPEDQKVSVYNNFFEDERNFGYIVCNSTPENALIFLNDSCTNLYTPDTLKFIWPGNYTIACKYPEHRANSSSIEVRGNQARSINIRLQDTTQCVDFNPANSSFPAFNVSCLEIDNNNFIWAGTKVNGIIKFKESSLTWFNTQNSALINSNILYMELDSQDRIWAGTRQGLVMIDENDNMQLFTVENSGIPNDYIKSLKFDNCGNLWMAAGNPQTDRFLVKYDGTNWTSYPSDRMIMALEVDHQNRIWVGLDVGLKVFENEDWVEITASLLPDHQLKVHPVEYLLTDNEGRVWIGAAPLQRGFTFIKGGLYFATGNDISFYVTPERLISDISLAANGNKWITCYGEHSFYMFSYSWPVLMKIDPEDNITSYSYTTTSFPTNRFTCSEADQFGNLWLGSAYNGLMKFKGANLD